MYTSVMLFALSGCFAHTAIPVAPAWQSDYTLALKEGQSSKRPLAIFVAAGPEGWDKLSKDGGLDKEAKELLLSRYVCVYIDSTKAKGRHLADEFEMPNGRGVVLSDGSGEKQAFWHAGTLSNDDLNHYLRKYADPERVVVKTETVPQPRPQAAPTPPAYYPPPTYYPSAVPSFRGCST
jgi:hypothetical protein